MTLKKQIAASVSMLALMALPQLAQAQSEPAGEANQNAAEIETSQPDEATASSAEIVVTGSRLTRSGFTTPNPVTVIGAAQIQQLGQVNIGEAVRTLPQNVSKQSDTNTGLTANQANFNIGANVVDLRGLNPNNGVRTLVLVNTKRFVPSTSGGAVDLNMIPSMLVKSLETVTGGASAAYGTDALAGVVNVILDTKLTGMKAQVDFGQTFQGDGPTYHWSFAGGKSFADGRGHIVVGAEWQDTGAVGDCVYVRAWCAKSPDTYQNEGYRANGGAGNGSPQYVRGDNSAYTNYALSTVLRGTTATARVNPVNARNLVFSSDGRRLLDFDAGNFVQSSGFGDRQGGACTTDCSPWSEVQLRPQIERIALYAHSEFEFSPNIKGIFEASYGRRESSIQSISQGPSSGTPLYTDNAYLQGVTYFDRATNSNRPLVGPGGLIPSAELYCGANATNAAICNGVSQPVGGTLAPLFVAKHYRNVPGGRSAYDTDLNTWRVMAGLEGSIDLFGGGWKWDAYYQHGQTKQSVIASGNRVNTFFIYALDAVDQGLIQNGVANGNIVCRATLPGPANRILPPGFENLYNQPNAAGCVPLNILGTNTENQAAVAYSFRDATETFTYKQQVAAANLRGDLFEGWAGPVGLAVGAEYRFEEGFAVHNKLPFNVVNTNSPFGADYGGSLKILEGYVETNIPLVKDLPFLDLVELNGSFRQTRQTNRDAVSGNAKTQDFSTWKISGTWDVSNWLRFRATRSRDVRAASFADLYTNFPAVEPGPPAGAAFNRFVGGTSVGGVASGGPNTFARILYPSNFGLTPEIGDTFTAGAVLSPGGFLNGLRISVDYYDIKIRDVILSLSSQEVVDACFVANVLCNQITNAAGTPFSQLTNNADRATFGSITRGAANLASFRQKGWDVEVLYSLPLDRISTALPGVLTLRGLGTITSNMTVNLGNGSGSVEYQNQTGGSAFGGFTAPAKYILTGYTSYAVSGFNITVDAKYIPRGIYDIRRKQVGTIDPLTGQAVVNTTENSINDNTVGSRIYIGLSTSYRFSLGSGPTMELFASVRNLFDRDPPSAASNIAGTLGPVRGGGGPTNPVFYDTLGAQWRAGIRLAF